MLAGRRLGPWVTAFSERASGESAWLLLGLPGAAIAVGYGEIWVLSELLVVLFFLVSYSRAIRAETEKYEALTIPDYLQKNSMILQELLRHTLQ